MATDTMLAVVKTHPERGVAITRVDVPGCRPHEVLVRLRATSVCDTDVHIFDILPDLKAGDSGIKRQQPPKRAYSCLSTQDDAPSWVGGTRGPGTSL